MALKPSSPASTTEFPAVICTVDVVLLTLKDQALHVVLVDRDRPPFAGVPALPGGFVHVQEDATAWHAAARALQEKAGIVSPYLEQLATWSGAKRDSRGWSVSIVYYAVVAFELLPADRPGLRTAPIDSLPSLPFDHGEMVATAVARVRTKSQYSSLPIYLCGERVTLPQLQAVYEAVLGEPINKVSFRRKIEELGMLEPIAGETTMAGAHRPAQVYQLRPQYRRKLSVVPRGINALG
ncbi:NUDIX domain-containing protein [Ideonella azotifigens]|uniref:NUDIX domain-containing protein n=1 Tax=Ideonella azotifigens TaxID=513160 RepID=A0ABN1KKD3_9BURK|nr:NUDIX domain-containing protein [Ideonella azotifigens]MCD2339246.1 NUDIX domain-containing protein [Ideonella azotifigens]